MTTSDPQTQVPAHVRAAFGLSDDGAEAVAVTRGTGSGWLVDGIVFSPVVEPALANWSARVRSTLRVPGLQVAEPVRSRDGRHVVDGWRADTALPGRPEGRCDETIGWAQRINAELAGVERPQLPRRPDIRPWPETDLFVRAEQAVWNGNPEVDLAPGMEDRGTPFATHRAAALLGAGALVKYREPVDLPSQVIHGDLARGLLYDAGGEPGLADVVPYHRPPTFAAALVAVDHLTWGLVDEGVLRRWEHLDGWPQLVLRAAVFRLGIHALHPGARPAAVEGLQSMSRIVDDYVRSDT